MTKTPIIGFVRYSCRASFSQNDFFLPKNMDYRLNIFRNVTLKSFQEQTDKDFNIILLHSENLPENYKEIFKKIENENSFLINKYIPDSDIEGEDYINAVTSTVEFVNFNDGMSINFRIDNDDGLPRDFISRLKQFLKPEFTDYAISIPKVSIIQRIQKNKYLIQEKYLPSNSMGLAFVTNKDNYKTIMTQGDHGKINQKYPIVLLPGNGGIQTINGKNIMNALYNDRTTTFDESTVQTFLRNNNYSNFDFKCLNVCKRYSRYNIVFRIYKFIKRKMRVKKNGAQ